MCKTVNAGTGKESTKGTAFDDSKFGHITTDFARSVSGLHPAQKRNLVKTMYEYAGPLVSKRKGDVKTKDTSSRGQPSKRATFIEKYVPKPGDDEDEDDDDQEV